MKKKLILTLLIGLLALFAVACAEEEVEEVLISETISHDHFHFEIPKGFVIMEERSTETTTYYESPLHEFSKIIYKTYENTSDFNFYDGAATFEDLKAYNYDTYLARTHPELVEEEKLEINGFPAYKYIVSYNLFDAPMLHLHCHIEDGDTIHHLEYIAVEEEGYTTSFHTYFDNIRVE